MTTATNPLTLLPLLALLAASWACLITNCPRGGKRSDSGREVECPPCGPGGNGFCVGPGICCSPLFGCVLSTRGSCSRAAVHPPQCTPPSILRMAPVGAPCGSDLTPDGSAPGKCAANGVCCTHDSCRLDSVCIPRDDNELSGSAFDSDLLPTLRQFKRDISASSRVMK